MDPSLIEGMMNTGEHDPEFIRMQQQQQQINRMRQQAQAGSQGTHIGGRQFIANIPGAIAGGIQNYRANQMQGGVDQGMIGVQQRANKSRSAYQDALMMAMRQNYPAQPGMLPPDGMEDR